MPLSVKCLNIIDEGLTFDLPHSFIILMEISSRPWALLTFRDLIIFNMSALLKLIEESLAVDL